ncbi:response regulator transcription factor [Shimia sp. R11_0]|uniref:response regulator transcription factor n=1 Tax=Shimia sp. R11_0 TaxID=2821096 RepID=UPI001ADB80D2|nr:response regulator transcription factor [Shimia sp. R11_0]
MSRIILIDPDRDCLSLLQSQLEAEGHVVRTHVDPDTALPDVARQMPDLVIMETRFAKMDGLAVFDRLRDGFRVPVMIASATSSDSEEAMYLRLGASDYLAKPFARKVMSARVAAALRVGFVSLEADDATQVLQRGLLRLDKLRHLASWDGKDVMLTASEFNVLWIIAQRPGHVFSRAAILDQAHGGDADVTDRSIDSQVKRIRRKLRDVAPEFNAIQTLYGLGYRFTEPSSEVAA